MIVAANPFVLLGWGLVAFVFYLNWRGYFKPARFWYFGPFTTLVYGLVFMGVFMALLAYVAKDPAYTTTTEKLATYRENNDIKASIDLVREQDSLHRIDETWGLKLVDLYLHLPLHEEYAPYRKQARFYFDKLMKMSVKGDDCERSYANHLLMHWYIGKDEPVVARHFAEQPPSCYSQGFYTEAALLYHALNDDEKAFEAVLKAIELEKNPKEAFAIGYSLAKNDKQKTEVLLNIPKSTKYFNFSTLRHIYLEEGQWGRYLYSLYFGMLFRYHPFYVLISLLIVGVVAYYFYQIDVFDRDSGWRLLTAFLIGCLLVPFTLFIDDMYDFGWAWYQPIAGNNIWVTMVLRVGVTEESVKILVLLLAVYLFKWVNEPLDFIIYASMGALAFAFLENTIYFDRTNGDVVFVRTLFSTLGHVFYSSLIAYGLAVNRFKWKRKVPVASLLPLLLVVAAIWHGTFNTLLMSSNQAVIIVALLPYSILIMAFLGGMINNAMNNSPMYNKHLITNNDSGINLIATSFVLLYLVQQCIYIYMNDAIYETAHNMLNTVVLVALMVVILAYFLGTFDVVPGQWQSLFKTIVRRRINRNIALQVKCEIFTPKNSEIQHVSDFLFGVVTDRLVIAGDDAFFNVALSTPYYFDGEAYNDIVIRHIHPRQRIRPGIEFKVRLIVPLSDEINFTANNPRHLFEYVGEGYLRCPIDIQDLQIAPIAGVK